MLNHNKAQQSSNRVHISWDILYGLMMIKLSDFIIYLYEFDMLDWLGYNESVYNDHLMGCFSAFWSSSR